MRNLISLLLCAILFCRTNAQSPQALNYQAIARTADGAIMPSQNIQVRFSILDQNISGTTLYSETHQATTNMYGLFTLAIGKGTPVSASFSSINWASGSDKFLKVEIALSENSKYQLQGTTQLLSVPYALYAEKTKLAAGNNTVKIANGNTISGNYQAGEGISINGNVISLKPVSEKGIKVKDEPIALNNTAQWKTSANGIYYPASRTNGNVGIGTPPLSNISFVSNGDIPGIYEGNAGMFTSSSPWHTIISIKNNKTQFNFIVGGPANRELRPNNFGILNGINARWPLTIDGRNNNIGIGDPSPYPTAPKSSLHIKKGDTYIEEIGSGIILKSPDGRCWRVTVDNTGNLVRTSITCPS